MSTSTIELDTKRYGRLLAKALPAVIKSEDENNPARRVRWSHFFWNSVG
jgi:hypothetical protein